MSRRKILFFISIAVLVMAAALLISGSSLLVKPISSDPYIPLGTPLTWFGIVALPLSIYLGNEKLRKPNGTMSKYLSTILKITLLIAILWAPICYLLAGNFSNSFTEKAEFQGGQLAMKWFWRYTYGLVIVPVLILFLFWIRSLLSKSKQ